MRTVRWCACPVRAAVGRQFGWAQCANHRGLQERYPQGRVSVLYDLLNQIALETRLVGSTATEAELAQQHLAAEQPDAVLLIDWGFTGYRWQGAVRAAVMPFVSRAARRRFTAVQRLFVRAAKAYVAHENEPSTITFSPWRETAKVLSSSPKERKSFFVQIRCDTR